MTHIEAKRLALALVERNPLVMMVGTVGQDGAPEIKAMVKARNEDVREKMADLARMETVLSELVCACHARKGNVSCPLIASLQGEAGLARSAM
ncbi:TPA: hypothetical protein HMT16_26465, partial [Escherichia coli]|nr:hypothetical protein [Escherichia coli]HAJ2808402.1 hypothetical protein [Escherichia coli]HAJ2864113.1 hypothetical protein [Escherichia coli]